MRGHGRLGLRVGVHIYVSRYERPILSANARPGPCFQFVPTSSPKLREPMIGCGQRIYEWQLLARELSRRQHRGLCRFAACFG